MSKTLHPSKNPAVMQLLRALDKNATVKESVERTSDELAVVNTVLKQELPGDVKIGDVARALQQSEEIEIKIQDTAQDLAKVNEVLAQEIDERAELERELAVTKAALALEKAKH